jgi:predicted acyltransferase
MMVIMQLRPSANTTPTSRVLSIDVLRGITIAFMILVNDPGDTGNVYFQLDHSRWNGCTLTDLVFPTFLFLVGASLILSLRTRILRGASRRVLALHILRRSAILFALDLFIAAMPHFHLAHLRLYGVLTRIALCYLCAGLICLVTQRANRLLAICAALLIGYWALMRFLPVPGFGVPTHEIPLLDPDRNLVAWLDRGITAFLQRTIHTGVLFEGTRDPEGLLSTLPAIATTLLGSVTALWLRRTDAQTESQTKSKPEAITKLQCTLGLLFSGLLGLISGLIWNSWFPLNKKLWTSSYVLFASGCALVGLAACYWLIDVRRVHETKIGRWLTWPWLVFGSNAIVAYAVSELTVEILMWIKVHDDGKSITAWAWIYRHIFSLGQSTKLTSLAFALAYVAACFLPNWLLWRKRIFVKI